MARGRMLMLAAGMRMGQQQAQQQAAQAEAYRQQGAAEAMAQQAQVQQMPAQDDVIAQIERLATLHTSGALTDEEFAAAKRKLLA